MPGSILQVRVDTTNPMAHGLPEDLKVMFNKSPVFRLQPDAAMKGVRPIAWFAERPTSAERLGLG